MTEFFDWQRNKPSLRRESGECILLQGVLGACLQFVNHHGFRRVVGSRVAAPVQRYRALGGVETGTSRETFCGVPIEKTGYRWI